MITQFFLLYSLSLATTITDPNAEIACRKPEKSINYGNKITENTHNELAVSDQPKLNNAADKSPSTSTNGEKKLTSPPKKTYKKVSATWISFLSVLTVALITTSVNLWYFKGQLRQKDTEQKIARLQNLLDTFYGPMLTLKKASKNLHDLLKTRISSSGEANKEDWRTLTKLLQGYDFSTNDRALIRLIININKEIDILIGKHSGLIESQTLQEKVQSLRTHYRLIEAAYEKKIIGEEKRFESFVYPTGLDENLEKEVQRLNDILKNLMKHGKKQHQNIRQSGE